MDPQGGHHADLNWPHAEDPPSLVAAREQEAALLEGWLAEYREALEGAATQA